tara:strand:+ start:166 stop:471 length:306 start_codon:yes stop_codon:yes gene_type:complete
MKLFRSSGTPIQKGDNEKYMTALSAGMDSLEVELGKCNSENFKEFQARLEVVHRELTKNFPTVGIVAHPKTPKQLSALLKTYGTVAFCEEDGKTVCYIMDS